ncbi:MAG: hypothetical protein DMG24_11580 [Acidobacteria bacterium]|nr:MAG: hypothetical protein DMG24_11580 [Acidobacteriota bacterium]
MPKLTGAERRRSERKPVTTSLVFEVDLERNQIAGNAFAVDLSELGARIRSSINLQPGQLITIIPKEGRAQAVPSRVIWVGEAGTTREREAGIAFLEPINLQVPA